MGEIVSRVKYFVDCSFGSFQLKRVDTCDVSFDHDLEVVTAGGVDGGAGYREQTGGGELQVEAYVETGSPELDYLRLFLTRETFRWVIQEQDGQRFQYRYVRVAKPPGRKYDSKGNAMMTVTMKFLQFGTL